MLNILLRLAISAAIATVALPISIRPSCAAEPTLNEILTGKTVPNTIKLKDLTPEWRALATTGQLDFGNTFQAMMTAFGAGALNSSYYTKGQTIALAGETYMVAYSLLDRPDKITGETTLGLSLLNLKTIGSLTNIRTFNVMTETALLEKQLQGMGAFTSPKSPPTEVKQEEVTPAPTKPQPTSKKKRRIRR
jgi:hypothetical protein